MIFYEKNKTSFDVKKRHHAPSSDTMLFFLWHVFDAFDTMFFQEFFIFLLGGLRCTVVCVSIYIYIYIKVIDACFHLVFNSIS